MPLSPWWDHDNGLLHPTAPLAPVERVDPAHLLLAKLHMRESTDRVTLHFTIGSSYDDLDIRVSVGRLILTGNANGTRFTRAVTLPANLDLAHRHVRIRQGEISVGIERYPEGAWSRRWTAFRHWLLAVGRRLWEWWSPSTT